MDEIDLLAVWRVIASYKRFIGSSMGAVFILTSMITFMLPDIYVARTSILPPEQEALSIAQKFKGFIPLSGNMPGSGLTSELWVGVLNSRSVSDAIIERFDLKNRSASKTVEHARKKLKQRVHIERTSEDIISISVEDRDPDSAAQIANAYIQELDRINQAMVMTAGRRARVFLEKRLDEVKSELSKAEEFLRDFQETNRAVKLDEQSKAVIGIISSIKGKLIAKEVELQRLLSFATPYNPKVELLQTEVRQLRENLREMEEGTTQQNSGLQDIFIPTVRIPDLSMQYARLLRDAQVQQTLYDLLVQQYEMARIQEAKDSPTVQVLDLARPPEQSDKPRRMWIVLFATVISGLFSVGGSLLIDYLGKNWRRPGSSGHTPTEAK